MTTPAFPKASLLQMTCPRCKVQAPESAGYRKRKLRDVGGVREVKVLRVRCRHCKKLLRCLYPPGVSRGRWYSHRVQRLLAILLVHQVDEGCRAELVQALGYPLTPATQNRYEDLYALRVQQHRQQEAPPKELKVVSVDEFRLGKGWAYVLSEAHSQAVIAYTLSASRDEAAVRQLLEDTGTVPEVVLSDGCRAIEAAVAYSPGTKQAACWFHLLKGLGKNLSKEQRQELRWRVEFLMRCETLEEAERFLKVLKVLYKDDLSPLQPLLEDWEALKLRWQREDVPLTNNCSETLFRAVWPRARKRVCKAKERAWGWLHTALYRWNHHPVRGQTPRQRLMGQQAREWLKDLVTPRRNYSYDF